MKEQIKTDAAPAPGGAYSQGIRAGDFVFVAGQAAFDAQSLQLVGDTIEAQTEKTLQNVEAILHAAGGSLDDVVKTTVHLQDLELFDRFDSAYDRAMPADKPVRTTVASGIGTPLVEIDVIAHIPRPSPR